MIAVTRIDQVLFTTFTYFTVCYAKYAAKDPAAEIIMTPKAIRIAVTYGADPETGSVRSRSRMIIVAKIMTEITEIASAVYITYPSHVMISFVTDGGGVYGDPGGSITGIGTREGFGTPEVAGTADVEGIPDVVGDSEVAGAAAVDDAAKIHTAILFAALQERAHDRGSAT